MRPHKQFVPIDPAIYFKFPLFSPRKVFSCFPSLFSYRRRRRHVTGRGRGLEKKKGNLSRHNILPRDSQFKQHGANHMPGFIRRRHTFWIIMLLTCAFFLLSLLTKATEDINGSSAYSHRTPLTVFHHVCLCFCLTCVMTESLTSNYMSLKDICPVLPVFYK